jgi:glycosyltransferase involved in cell wall biosynthesis
VTPPATVVVPTRDRPESLARCLEALAAQTLAGLEVVVVDDGSVVPVIATGARVVRLEGRGAAAGRNAGVRASAGEAVLFTDDDCEPEPAWAELLVARLAAGADAAAGRTVPADPRDALAVAAETIAGYLAECARSADGSTAFAPSNNLACRAEVARAVPFDERFARQGGEDRDWCARLVGAGHRFVAAPEAVVRHRPRLTPSGYVRQQARYGGASSRYRRLNGAPPAERPGFYAGLLRRGFEHGAAVGSLVVVAQGAAVAGVLADRISALRARRTGAV